MSIFIPIFREKKTQSHKNLDLNVHSSLIHNTPKVETPQKFINRGVGKQTAV